MFAGAYNTISSNLINDSKTASDADANKYTYSIAKLANMIINPYQYQGQVATKDDLPSGYTAAEKGYTFDVLDTGRNFAWSWDNATNTGHWDDLGGQYLAGKGIKISGYTIDANVGDIKIDNIPIEKTIDNVINLSSNTLNIIDENNIIHTISCIERPAILSGLKFTSQKNNSKIGYAVHGTINKDIYISTDGINWSPWDGSVITLNNGEYRYIWNKKNTLNIDLNNYFRFGISGSISASGNVNSMINFSELYDYCYDGLFYNCAGLTNAPDLPAITLAKGCYRQMFSFCTGLTTAPDLPATNLAQYCYTQMFSVCTSLTSIKLYYTGAFGDDNFGDWVNMISTTGTLYYNGSDTTKGVSACPTGWAVQTF